MATLLKLFTVLLVAGGLVACERRAGDQRTNEAPVNLDQATPPRAGSPAAPEEAPKTTPREQVSPAASPATTPQPSPTATPTP